MNRAHGEIELLELFEEAGLQIKTPAMSGERIASTGPKRKSEELNRGALSEAAMRAISPTSASVEASGFSNTLACRKLSPVEIGPGWTRPATLSNRIPSTSGHKSGISLTNRTCHLSLSLLLNPSTRSRLSGMSGMPCSNTATTTAPDTFLDLKDCSGAW